LKVSTLISADFNIGSLKIAALTLVVMTLSSTYSPVPSCFGVDEHATEVSSVTARKVAERYLLIAFMDGSPEVSMMRLADSGVPGRNCRRPALLAQVAGAAARLARWQPSRRVNTTQI